MRPDAGPASGIALRCTVRGCARPLERGARAFQCAAGHAFDVAREGYVNLLQPQDRRSRQPGDAPAALASRARLWSAGFYDPLVARLALEIAPARRLADVGCGTGELLGRLAPDGQAVGIDLSTRAVSAAARAFPALTWVVANADRGLPLADRSIDVLCSITGPRHPLEFRRTLAPGGLLFVVVPAPDDLVELRQALLGEGSTRGRAEFWIDRLGACFALESRERLATRRLVEGPLLGDLAGATYRAGRGARAETLAAMGPMEVTIAFDILICR